MSEPAKKHPSECGNCRFWEPSGLCSDQNDSDRDEEVGECRRRSPLLVMIGALSTTRWPATVMSDWCGDWEHMGDE